jgi:Tol biopolymer transport system component
MSTFDKAILGAILGLALAIGALSAASAGLGPSVDTFTTARMLDGTSVATQIAITFTEPMKISSVEHSFRINPRVKGAFSWSGNELLFLPSRNLAYSSRYTVTISHAAQDVAGKHLARSVRNTFITQSRHLLFLGTHGSETHRLVLASVTGKRQVVGSNDGLVTDFSTSFDRSLVVYVKRGQPSERADEIWLLSLADNSTQRVFRHPDWTISQPHLSPDGRFVTFLATNVLLCRKYYGCYRDKSGPIVYLLDLRSRHAFPFQSSGDAPITDSITFSPAGQIAYTDLGSALTLSDPSGGHVVHIPDQGNSLDFSSFDATGDQAAFVGQTPSSSGGDVLIYSRGKYVDISHGIYDSSTPSLSNSGKYVAYAAYRGERGIEPMYGINVYDMTTKLTRRLGSERRASDWAPQWSVDDRYIAFIRSRPQEAMYMGSGGIWVMQSNGSHLRPLGDVGTNLVWVS